MILSSAILLVILLPTLLSILLSLPSIQNRIITAATHFATDFLGTEVSIGHIDISTYGDVEVENFLTRDLQGDTLLYVKKLSTPLRSFSLKEKELRLGSSSITTAQLNLASRLVGDQSVMNIKQIVELIAGEGSDNPLKIAVSQIEIEDVNISIKQLESRNPSYGVDYGDMQLQSVSGRVSDLYIDGPRIRAQIEKLSLREQSGFVLNRLDCKLRIGRGALNMEQLTILTDQSNLNFDRLILSGREWAQYRRFNQNVLLDIDLKRGYLSSNDVAYFAPALKSWNVRLFNLDLKAIGEVDGLSLDISNISYGEGTHISTDLSLSNASQIKNAYAKFNLERFTINATDAIELISSINSEALSSSNKEMIERIEELTIEGKAEGELNKVIFDGTLNSNQLGKITPNLTIDISKRGEVSFDGEVKIENFDLGTLLNNSSLGLFTTQNSVQCVIANNEALSLKLSSYVESIDIKGYPLSASTIDIDIEGSDANIGVVCADPNLSVELNSLIKNYTAIGREREDIATLDLQAQIEQINFTELGINNRDNNSTFAANVEIKGSGYDIDNISGSLKISDAKYIFDQTELATQLITLDMKDTKSGRIFTLNSEFADIVMNLCGSPTSNFDYLNTALADYLPSLYNTPYSSSDLYYSEGVEQKNDNDGVSIAGQGSSSHLSLVSVKLHNIAPIAEAFDSDFEASVDTKGLLLFDPVNREFTVTFNSSYLEHNALLAIGLEAQLTNHSDSVSLFSRAKELYIGTTLMENSTIAGGANHDNIEVNIGFKNQADSAKAEVVADMRVTKNAVGKRKLDIELQPSMISNATQRWDIRSQGVSISSNGLEFEDLIVESRNQSMTVNGCASSSVNDKLDVEFQNFDLSALSSVVSRVGYEIEGRTNGSAVISSALKEARIEANVALDSVSVNTIKSPDMRLLAQWDSQRNEARLHLLNRQNQDTLIRGYYIPTKVMYYARLNVDSVDLNLLDPPLNGTIHDTRGYANVDVTLNGQRRKATLEGSIKCKQVSTTVGFSGVRYSVDEGVIEVSDNKLIAKEFKVNDSASNGNGEGLLDMTVDLSQLKNVSYELNVQPRHMLVLNTTENDNDLFYGRVRASGVATISGNRNRVDMNITAVTDDNSQFFMPLNSKSSISQAEFITFVEPKINVDTTNIIVRKRESFQRQQSQNSSSANINIDLALQVRPNTDVQLVIDPTVGDIVRGRGEGNFNLRIEPKKNIFEIYGDYTITEGSYLFTLGNIVNKRFTINPNSTIQWSGDPLDAILDIAAVYKLKTSLQPLMADESTRAVPVDCIINLTDRLMQPEVSFGIELPSSDAEQQAVVANLLNDQETLSRQFFYLMLSNSFIPEATGTTSSDFGVSATAATGFELLANQLSNWLSTSNYNVVLRYRPESDLTGDEFDFGFSKGWIDNRLLIELEGNYIADNKQATTEDISNFMGEAYVTWLIDPAGALRLRGFTQTVDRYDENQGLQETGVGVYYTESFENFKDLRKRVKARFSASPERLEKRAARKDKSAQEEQEEQEKQENAQKGAQQYWSEEIVMEVPDDEF